MAFKTLALVFVVVLEINSIKCKHTRIVNGVDVRLGEVPYQVSIQGFTVDHFCGGVIINKYFVLTAAHCAEYLPKEMILVIIGTSNLDKVNQIRTVVQLHIHEEFKSLDNNQYKYVNDIALMRVDSMIFLDYTTRFVSLPKKGQIVPYKKKALATGWGKTSGPKSSHTKIMRKTEVQVLDLEICRRMYGNVKRRIHSKQLCTVSDTHERKGACNGDSGGPLVIDRHILIGISSWSRKDPDCASPLYPDVYTKVSEYIDWINAHIK